MTRRALGARGESERRQRRLSTCQCARLQPRAKSVRDAEQAADVHVLPTSPLPRLGRHPSQMWASSTSAAAWRQQLPLDISHALQLLRELAS